MQTQEPPYAMAHAINLGFITVFGDPKIGEPLSSAWQRCLEKYPQFASLGPFRDQTMAFKCARI